jgi:hypothetical protein
LQFACPQETRQWQPNLFRNTTQIYPFDGKFDGKSVWNPVTVMADDAIGWMNQLKQGLSSSSMAFKREPSGSARSGLTAG